MDAFKFNYYFDDSDAEVGLKNVNQRQQKKITQMTRFYFKITKKQKCKQIKKKQQQQQKSKVTFEHLLILCK